MPYLDHARTYQGLIEVFFHDPARYAPLLQFIDSVMTRESAFTPAEREMIATHVSRLNGCSFCVGAHKATLAAMGIAPETIAAVEAGPEGGGIERLRPVLRFATKLTQSPEAMGQGDVDGLRAAGWSDAAIEDAINVVALFNLVNRLVDAIGIEGNAPTFAKIGATLAKSGYGPLIQAARHKAG